MTTLKRRDFLGITAAAGASAGGCAGDDDMRSHLIHDDPLLRPQANRPASAAPIEVVEPAKGWWSMNANLGNFVTFDANSGPVLTQPISVVKLPEYGAPRLHTISLGLEESGFLNKGAQFGCEIVFGAGGVTQTFTCDWVPGQQITLPFNAVDVRAFDLSGGLQLSGAERLVFSALIGDNEKNKQPPVITMAARQTLLAGSTNIFNVPNFSRRIKVAPAFTAAGGAPETQIANFFSDLIVGSLKIGTGIAVTTSNTAFRFGDLNRNQIGWDVVAGAKRFVIVNNSLNDINATIWAELDG